MKKLSTLLLVLTALFCLPQNGQAQEAVFDFTSPTIRENIGEKLADVKGNVYNETFTADGVTLQVTSGSAPSKIYVDNNRGQNLVTYKEYTTLTFRAPAGQFITKIEFTAAGNSNINSLTPSSGTVNGMVWEGSAEGVRFSQGGTSYLANAKVTLAQKPVALDALTYQECDNIAAFNALANGTYAKVKLTNAEVIGLSADGFSTVFVQDATGGTWVQYTSLNAQLKEQTKLNGYIYCVRRTASGNSQMKEAEDTPNSELQAADIDNYTVLEGTLAELNKAENHGRLVKITGASFVATSATAGTLKQGDAEINVNNGAVTANQQLHKIDATWVKDETKMENVTIVAILVATSATKTQLLPLSMEEVKTYTFDFKNNPENWPVSTALFDDPVGEVKTLTAANGVVLTSIQNNEWNANLLYQAEGADPVLRVAKENAFKLAAPEGKALVSVAVTMASGTFDFTASNGTIADNVWTGNATEVVFTTTANRSISQIDVVLADENAETVKPAAAVEVANIAAFNAVADGTVVKLTLTNARVNANNGGSYYVEDASGATVFKGLSLKPGTQLNGYVVGTKSTDSNIDFMNTPAVAVEYQLTATDASTFEATETALVGTATTIDEACQQASYGRLVKIENVTITGSGQNKTLTDAGGKTMKARDYMGTLSEGYAWPEKAASITGVVVYYMTGWFIMPLDDAAIVADATGVRAVNAAFDDEEVYNLQGVKLQAQQKGLNIVGGKKIVVK